MADVLNYDLMMRLANADEITKEIQKLGKEGINLGLNKKFLTDLNTAEKQLKKATSSAAADLIKKGFDPKIIEQNILKANEALRKDMIQAIASGEKVKLAGVKKRIKKQMAGAINVAKYESFKQKQAEKDKKRGVTERTGAFASGIADAFSKVTAGGKESFAGLASTITALGASMKKAGLGKQAKAGAGGMSGLSVAFGKFQAGIGKALKSIGMFAAGFVALGAAMLGAEAKVKKWNKTFVEAGGNVRDLTNDMFGAEDAFKQVRKVAAEQGEEWGTLIDEQMRGIGVLSSLGYRYRELGGTLISGRSAAYELAEGLNEVNMQARNTGMSFQETATAMMDYLNELGGTLKGVSNQFTMVQEMAMQSSFGVKRFFSIVLQATSGMAMYNVRLQDAAALLTNLTKILGKRMGADFLQSITKGFVDESYQERYKRILLTGQKKTAKIFQASAEASANDFLGKFGETFGKNMSGADMSKKIAGVFSDMGLKFDVDMAAITRKGPEGREARADASKELVKVLRGLSPKKQEQLLARMKSKLPPALTRQFESLLDVAKGTNGRIGDMAKGLGALDIGGRFAMQLNRVKFVFKKPLHRLSAKQLMAVEHMTGMTGQQLENMRRISRQLYGSWDLLNSFKDESKAWNEMNAEEREAWNQKNMEMAKAHGAALTKNGQIVQATWDAQKKEIVYGNNILKSSDEYLRSQSSVIQNQMEPAMDNAQFWAKQTMDNTTSMNQLLQQGVERFLMGIFEFVEGIMKVLVGGMGTTEKRYQAAIKRKLTGRAQELQQQRQDLTSKIHALHEEAAKASKERKVEIKQQIAANQKALRDVELAIKINTKAMIATAKLKGKGGVMGFLGSDKSQKQMMAEVQHAAAGGFAVKTQIGAGTVTSYLETMAKIQIEQARQGRPLTMKEMEKLGVRRFLTDFQPSQALNALIDMDTEAKKTADAIKKLLLDRRKEGLAKRLEAIEKGNYTEAKKRELSRKARQQYLDRDAIRAEQQMEIWTQLSPKLMEQGKDGESALEMAGLQNIKMENLGTHMAKLKQEDIEREKREANKELKERPEAVAKKTVEEQEKLRRKEAAQKIGGALGLSEKDIGKMVKALEQGKAMPKGFTSALKKKGGRYQVRGEGGKLEDVTAAQWLMEKMGGDLGGFTGAVTKGIPKKDFILTGRGPAPRSLNLTDFSQFDTVMGLQRDGKVDKALAGRGGKQVVNNFYINGGNPQEVQGVVIQALKRVYGNQHFVGAIA